MASNFENRFTFAYNRVARFLSAVDLATPFHAASMLGIPFLSVCRSFLELSISPQFPFGSDARHAVFHAFSPVPMDIAAFDPKLLFSTSVYYNLFCSGRTFHAW